MGRYKSVGVNQAEVNADLRARYGDTVTRQQVMTYRDETGIDPRWIRKNAACSIGRGLYRIPGGEASAPKEARRRSVPKDEMTRPVIPTPFDDEMTRPVIPTPFDGQDDETPIVSPKRTRRTDDPYANREVDANGEIPAPVYIHAWICDKANETGCPGRKPGDYYPPDGGFPKCECGSTMSRHAWSRKQKLF